MSDTKQSSVTLDTPPADDARQASGAPFGVWAWCLVLPAIGIVSGVLMAVGDLDREVVGGIGVLLMITLMAMKIPLGAAMAIPGFLGIYGIVGERSTEGALKRLAFEASASWSLTVVPMFVLMGLALWRSGITERIYLVARQWVGWLPGGLAVGTNLAGAGFASMSGSSIASLYPMTLSGMPEMLKAGYDKRLAAASILAAGTLAHLIPPSLFLIIYAGVAQTPIGPQMMAGLVPGIVLTLLYSVAIIGVSMARPRVVGGSSARLTVSWEERWRSLRSILAAPLLVVVVLGGLYGGLFTATESAAVGAFGGLAILLVHKFRDKPFAAVRDVLAGTVATVGAVFFLLVGAVALSRMLSISGIAQMLVDGLRDAELSRVEFILVIGLLYLIMGMFMDPLAMMLLTVPVLLPVLPSVGITDIWFGVFVVIFMELAILTPPLGVVSYIFHGIVQSEKVNLGQQISLSHVFTAVACLLPIPLLLIAILVAFPGLVEWLPATMGT